TYGNRVTRAVFAGWTLGRLRLRRVRPSRSLCPFVQPGRRPCADLGRRWPTADLGARRQAAVLLGGESTDLRGAQLRPGTHGRVAHATLGRTLRGRLRCVEGWSV